LLLLTVTVRHGQAICSSAYFFALTLHRIQEITDSRLFHLFTLIREMNMELSVHKSEKDLRLASGHAALANMLHGLLMNQQVIADEVGVELPFGENAFDSIINNVYAERKEILSNVDVERKEVRLPLILQKLMLNKAAFDYAVEEGYVQMGEGGCLTWHLGNSTLLAYFLGRLFCGDYCVISRSKGAVWTRGEGVFPASELQRLFGISTLGKLRQKRANMTLPENYKFVEEIFEKYEC